jgi:signal peptidase II
MILIAALIIIADQVTKTIVRQNLEYAQMWIPFGIEWLYPYFYFVHWYNTGAAFGIFQDANTFFSVLSIIIIAIIIYYFPKISDEDWHMRFALSLALGGAFGNLIDRLTIKHVTDFIAVGSFPIFNVADASISIGVAVLIIGMWFKEKEKGTQAEQIQDA